MKKIAAVVVTYNRLQLLKECISHLRNQTKPLDAIIVIDNGSSDGTEMWLANQSELIYYRQKNLGGSGGFYTGIKMAYDAGYEWIWIMDDDAFPEKQCLEKISSYYQINCENTFLVIAPTVVEGNEIDHGHRGFIDLNRVSFPLKKLQTVGTSAIADVHSSIPITFASFIGMCMHRKIVEIAGLPARDYFIYNDDVEYSLRIAKAGFPILLLTKAFIYHKVLPEEVSVIQRPVTVDNGRTKSMSLPYKGKRTQWKTAYSNSEKLPLFQFMGKRNLLRTIIIHKGITPKLMLIVFLEIIDSFIYILHAKNGRLKLWRLYYQSFKQGLSGRYDNDAFHKIAQQQ